jgi:PAS domain S-box-containing protein
MLRKHGFAVLEAATGEDALRLSDAEHPDLVLLDVNLPDIHGFDVARRMKAAEMTRHTPILHLSASAIRPEDRVGGLAAGADAYLVEPVDPGELVANIHALLRLRNAEAGLQRTSAILAAVVESSPLGIAVFDEEHILRWNPAAERLFGIQSADVEGRSMTAIPWPPSLARHRDVASRLAQREAIAPIEYEYTREDGTAIDVAMFAAPLAHSRGYVAIFEDISNRKRFERERSEWLVRERQARAEAEYANRLKDEFLATLSHELRTPLNAILGWLMMLRQEMVDAEKRDHALDVIERNARAQQQIINDILEVAQIVRGQLRLEPQSVDVAAAVQTAIESVRPAAAAKRQNMTVEVPPQPAIVSADPARIQQILWNLLSNATKYTPRDGRIDVTVFAGASDVEITIRDNGIGIAPEMLPHVFERFRQGDAGPTREYGGLGLGLALVRHLAEMHGGSVRAASEGLGHGAAFTLSLPLAAV